MDIDAILSSFILIAAYIGTFKIMCFLLDCSFKAADAIEYLLRRMIGNIKEINSK